MATGTAPADASATAALEELTALLADNAAMPLWDRYQRLVKPEPSPPDESYMWRWETMEPLVSRAGDDVKGELANHRVILFNNPAFAAPRVGTTTNLMCGLQCVMPGESTAAHRHTPAAVRFLLESGGGATTLVDGKSCPMHEGDMILTPNLTWHEHYNDSDRRTVWLDTLDVPLVGALGAVFFEDGPATEYPATVATLPDGAFANAIAPATGRPGVPYSPRFRYPWADVLDALAETPAAADGSRRVRYTNPADGGAVMPTLDCYALELARGQETVAARSTSNAVCVVAEGEGSSVIGGVTHQWRRRDVFTVPHWTWATHTATTGIARLFMVSDRETLRRLGLLRDETQA